MEKNNPTITDTVLMNCIQQAIKELNIPCGFVKLGNTNYAEEIIVLNNRSITDITQCVKNIIRIRNYQFTESNTDPKYIKHAVSVIFYFYHYVNIRQDWNEYWLRIFPIFEPI